MIIMLRAFKLSTGPGNASHVAEGAVALDRPTDVATVRCQKSPPHSSFDWHDASQRQYVLTLSGTLEFTTRDGETFVLRPGDILVAAGDAGSGHKWRPVDDDPWRRCDVPLKPGAADLFASVPGAARPS
jgi:quercetin dioxygenase-like cupin family protein